MPNRRSFEEQLEQATARARRSSKPLTLVFIDLDGFKRVNDTLGHAIGNELLIQVARCSKPACAPPTTSVSRLGGDEFTVILEESGTANDRLALCERLLNSLPRPHMLAGKSVISTPSLGVAVYVPGERLDELRARRCRDLRRQARRQSLPALGTAGGGEHRQFASALTCGRGPRGRFHYACVDSQPPAAA